ncbi:MAG: hypothetical protein SGCHY_004890 [Lobulomycetales sp.]
MKIYTLCCLEPRLGVLAISLLTFIYLLTFCLAAEAADSPYGFPQVPELHRGVAIAGIAICSFGAYAGGFLASKRLAKIFSAFYGALMLCMAAMALVRLVMKIASPSLTAYCLPIIFHSGMSFDDLDDGSDECPLGQELVQVVDIISLVGESVFWLIVAMIQINFWLCIHSWYQVLCNPSQYAAAERRIGSSVDEEWGAGAGGVFVNMDDLVLFHAPARPRQPTNLPEYEPAPSSSAASSPNRASIPGNHGREIGLPPPYKAEAEEHEIPSSFALAERGDSEVTLQVPAAAVGEEEEDGQEENNFQTRAQREAR